VLPASGRSTSPSCTRHGAWESVAAFSAGDSSVESNPLTSLAVTGIQAAEATLSSHVSPFPPGHVNAPDAPELEMPSTREDHAGALSRARRERRLAGRRGQPPHVFTDVREHRLDLSRLAFAGSLQAACASLASADKCLHEHDCGPLEHPGRRICGRGDCHVRSSCLDRGQSPSRPEVRGRGQPVLDAPRDDCSARRLCPNLDPLGRLLSRSSLSCPCPE
jgi:hypothetical protein